MKRPNSISDYRKLQESIYGDGQKWIVALDILASTRGMISGLRERGAGPCLAIAAARGTGTGPDPEWGPEPIVFDVEAGSMMQGIWKSQELLANLPVDAIERIDAFDPAHQARVIGTIFDDGADVGGRRKFGRRRDEWRALEDKVVIDALWEELAIPHAPYAVVDANLEALTEAARRLDQGLGTVWSGDSTSGFHGGAEFTRWVATSELAEEAAAHLSSRCRRARVMPFLEGIPCSIHGIVFPDWVLAGRPCEMLVMRHPGTSRLRYATAASFWDPPDIHRDSMRAMTRRVGAHLRDTVDYRGAFTIDGIMTRDGFVPTELNPRFGGALGLLVAGLDLGLIYVDLALMEGVDVDWNPQRLEEIIIENADEERRGHSNMIFELETTETTRLGLKEDRGQWSVVDDDEDADVSVLRGPAAAGTYVRLSFSPDKTPVGPSTAPRAAAVLRKLDDLWNLGIGEVESARDLHASD